MDDTDTTAETTDRPASDAAARDGDDRPDRGETARDGRASVGDGSSGGSVRADDAAASFLELESDLDAALDATETRGRRRALVVGAERVAPDAVPADYPVDVDAERALALRLATGAERETVVYLAWPDAPTEDAPLVRLLDAVGVDHGSFADLYGVELLVERVDGHDIAYVPSEPPTGSGDWSLGVPAGGLLAVAALALLASPLGALPGVLALLASLIILPLSIYRDAWYLRTHSDWSQGPLFWATLALFPALNAPVAALYLRSRGAATFLGPEPSLRTRLARRLRSLLGSR